MNYIIFDLEFNQKHPDEINSNSPAPLMFEIIQIGAIKLDENFNEISSYNTLIKPQLHKKIHPYIEKLTNITDKDLKSSLKFADAYNNFLNFIGDEPAAFVVWGNTDIKELMKHINHYNLSVTNLPKVYIDIQNHASKYFKIAKGRKIGLKRAVEEFNIPHEDEFHDAYFDAFFTAEILKKFKDKKLKLEKYTQVKTPRHTTSTGKSDTSALIRQFEKMYNRKLTAEEIKMIKVAYNMGKTKQFILK